MDNRDLLENTLDFRLFGGIIYLPTLNSATVPANLMVADPSAWPDRSCTTNAVAVER